MSLKTGEYGDARARFAEKFHLVGRAGVFVNLIVDRVRVALRLPVRVVGALLNVAGAFMLPVQLVLLKCLALANMI